MHSGVSAVQDLTGLGCRGAVSQPKQQRGSSSCRKLQCLFNSRLKSRSEFWLCKSSWCVQLKYSNSFFFKLWTMGLQIVLQLNWHCNTTRKCFLARDTIRFIINIYKAEKKKTCIVISSLLFIVLHFLFTVLACFSGVDTPSTCWFVPFGKESLQLCRESESSNLPFLSQQSTLKYKRNIINFLLFQN